MSNKNLLKTMSIGESRRIHYCRRNSAHELPKGAKILVVREGRDERHYCIPCARKLIGIAQFTLDKLQLDTATS